jgi:hypothetical protein
VGPQKGRVRLDCLEQGGRVTKFPGRAAVRCGGCPLTSSDMSAKRS